MPSSPLSLPKSDYPHISSSFELCFQKKKKEILLDFSFSARFWLRIRLLILSRVSRRCGKKSWRFRLWNIQIEFQMEIEGVIAFILWPLREGKSSSSALEREIYQENYSRPRKEKEIRGSFELGEVRWGEWRDEYLFCFILKRLENFLILDRSECIIRGFALNLKALSAWDSLFNKIDLQVVSPTNYP